MKVGDRVRMTDVCIADLRGRLGTVATLFNDADGFACIDIGDGGQAYGYPGHHFVLANEPPATEALPQVRCGYCHREIPCPCGAQPVYGGSPFQIVGWTPSSEYPAPTQQAPSATVPALARALFDNRLEAEAMRVAEGAEGGAARVLDRMWGHADSCRECGGFREDHAALRHSPHDYVQHPAGRPKERAECEVFAIRLVGKLVGRMGR